MTPPSPIQISDDIRDRVRRLVTRRLTRRNKRKSIKLSADEPWEPHRATRGPRAGQMGWKNVATGEFSWIKPKSPTEGENDEWQQAEDVETAEKQLLDLGVSEVDLSGASLFAANLIYQVMHDPSGNLLPARIVAKPLDAKEIDTLAYYDPEADLIAINTANEFWVGEAQAKRVLAEQGPFGLGFWVSDDTAYPLWHEYGHMLFAKRNPQGYSQGRKRLTPAQQAIAFRVSGVAADNRLEFIAEFFAGTQLGIEYDEEVKNLFKEFGGAKR